MTSQFCTFRLDQLTCGIEVSRVQEIIRVQQMTRVPLVSEVVEGLINLRGQIVTALDLRRRLDLPTRDPDANTMNIVVRTVDDEVSLLVDEIGDVVEVDDAVFEAPPATLRGAARELITGAYKLEGQLLLVLNIDRAVELDAA